MDHPRSVNQRVKDLLVRGTPAQRIEICSRNPLYFAIYYFPEYFKYKIPPFHFDFYQDILDLEKGIIQEAMWVCFRDSAKTSIAKIALVCWLICYKKRKYIQWDSSDGGNAEQALFDVTTALQSNKKIIADFGQLYYPKKVKEAYTEAKMKRVNKFITENEIKVEAVSARKSTRGHVKAHERPDCHIFDDMENAETIISYPITHRIKKHYDELKAGLPAHAIVLTLANLITEEGVVAYIMEKVKKNPKGRLRNVPAQYKDGTIAWPDKYTVTDKERDDINKEMTNKEKWKISLESRRKDLGEDVYQAEMMNNPRKSKDKIFDRDILERMLEKAVPPTETIANLEIWYPFKSGHRYAIGADTAKGVGIDSSTTVIMDFSTTPARVVATYASNLIDPDTFGHEIKRHANMYGQPLVAPEINNQGWATMSRLKDIYPLERIYLAIQEEKVKKGIAPEYGWDTNSKTKSEMIYQLKSAIEAGYIEILDKSLIDELIHYSLKDLKQFTLEEGMTRHFDKVIALAIAWQMKDHAKIYGDIIRNGYKQQDLPPIAGQYGG